jgi:hypothetical protein
LIDFVSENIEKPLMRLLSITRLSILAVLLTTLFSCNEKEKFTTEALEDYMPLTVGKYITYRLDSLVYTSFGRVTEIHKYQVKHIIDAKITDNQGRVAYRINTFIRDSVNTSSWTASQPWINSDTYFITPLSDQVEVADENNFRYIKLHLPIKEGFTWKGNRYLPSQPYEPIYTFSNDDNIGSWDYTYDSFLPTFSYRGINYSNVYSVEQTDEETNLPITASTSYASKSRSVEKYSKTIGLIYRENELWEYQDIPGGTGPYKKGFGITMWMIDHN